MSPLWGIRVKVVVHVSITVEKWAERASNPAKLHMNKFRDGQNCWKAAPNLFDPLIVGRLRLKNRIVIPPMANDLATATGELTKALIADYRRNQRNRLRN